jgi:regulatory protein
VYYLGRLELKDLATITAIKPGKNPRAQRSNLYLDGKFFMSLDNEVVTREHLRIGELLSKKEISLLGGLDDFQRCLSAGMRFLASRPRSESETRERLKVRGYSEEAIEKAVVHLKQLNLLNDAAFAQYWKENRSSFKPLSQRLLKMELRGKGLERELISEAVADLDETESAYQAALGKTRGLPVTEFPAFRQKIGAFLQRRGFSYTVINATLKRVWAEKSPVSSEDDPGDS